VFDDKPKNDLEESSSDWSAGGGTGSYTRAGGVAATKSSGGGTVSTDRGRRSPEETEDSGGNVAVPAGFLGDEEAGGSGGSNGDSEWGPWILDRDPKSGALFLGPLEA
jgi:hypothetical protein